MQNRTSDLSLDGINPVLGGNAMSFGQSISSFFVNYVTFSGRASRSEYWYAVLFLFLGSTVAGIIDKGIGTSALQAIFGLVTFLPNLALQVRRLHDLDRSGWWMFGLFSPGGFLTGLGIGMAFASATSKLGGGPAMTFMALGGIAILVGYVVLLVWNCTAGTPGANRFGDDRLAPAGRFSPRLSGI